VQALVDLACSHAGKDNITVVMMLIPWQELQTKKDVPLRIIIKKKKKRRPWLWVLIGLGLVLLALAVAGAAWAIFRFPIPHFFIPSPTP
jgi:hypothetical protein